MEYQRILESLESLEFIPDRESADSAAKAVLGMLASRLPEEQAAELTRRLPEPLTLARLRSHQAGRLELSRQAYIDEVAKQFELDAGQAARLVIAGLHAARMAAGDQVWTQAAGALPPDWRELLESA